MNSTSSIGGYRIGILLILAAIIALLTMAWRGLHNHRELVWNEAKEQAEEVHKRFEAGLSREMREVRLYQYPPSPGSFEFDPEASPEELRAQTNSTSRTTTGLPVAVLAAFELARRSGSIRDGELARDLARDRWPDLTSPLILEKLAELSLQHQWKGDFGDWKKNWQADEDARDLIREMDKEGWVVRDNKLHLLVKKDEQTFGHTVIQGDSPAWRDGRNFGIRLNVDGTEFGGIGKPLLSRPYQNATLSAGVIDENAVESEWRSRRTGTFLIIGLSTLVIGAGMWVMARGLIKEKRTSYAKSQFVASVTHELRAPVGSMRLMSESLQSGKLPPGKVDEFHRLMSRESNRLSVLIENVMDLARVEDGQRVLRKEKISVQSFAKELCEMMAMQCEESKIAIHCNGPEMEVDADPVALRQILVNLMDNAIKHSPKEGVVTLDWGEGWWISVSDQGPGIDPGDRDKIFERFYRGEDELRRKTKGVGIGLSLVRHLTELHGGRITVSNQGGAIFKVEFQEA